MTFANASFISLLLGSARAGAVGGVVPPERRSVIRVRRREGTSASVARMVRRSILGGC